MRVANGLTNHLNRFAQLFDQQSTRELVRWAGAWRAPADAEALTQACKTLRRRGKRDEAAQLLRDFLQHRGEEALEPVGAMALDLGMHDLAEQCYRRLTELQPQAATPLCCLGLVHAQRGDEERARKELLRATELEPENAEPWYRLGSFLLRKRELDEAEKHLRHALKLDPSLARAHTNLGFLLDLRGQRSVALREFQRAVHLSCGDPETHFNLGALHAEARNYDLAIEQFAEGVALAPESVEGHYNLGAAYFELRRYEQAIGAFRRALRLQPAHDEARYYLGLCYLRKGDYQRALQQLQHEQRADRAPSVRLLTAMALCYNGLEMPRQAVRLLSQVIELVPDHAKAYHLLGICFDKLGERERANDAYRKSDLHLTLARARRGAARLEGPR